MTNEKGLSLLKEKIEQIETLLANVDREALRQWREETLMILDSLIDQESKYYKNFENIRYTSAVVSMMDRAGNTERHNEAYKDGLQKAKASLKAIVFGIEKGLF